VQSDGVRKEPRFADGSGSIPISQGSSEALPIGQTVDATGFAELVDGGLTITDAELLPTNIEPHRADDSRVITTVAGVHALSPEEAGRAIPVRVRTTVTYINRVSTTIFVQDRTGAAYVYPAAVANFRVQAGDLVDLAGVSAPGQFASIISGTWAKRVSSSVMPPPAPVAFDDLFSGKMDSAWVQTEGIIQRVDRQDQTSDDAVWLQWGDHRYLALVYNPTARPLPPPDSRSTPGARWSAYRFSCPRPNSCM
jgi:hypothetical protein